MRVSHFVHEEEKSDNFKKQSYPNIQVPDFLGDILSFYLKKKIKKEGPWIQFHLTSLGTKLSDMFYFSQKE